MKDRRDREFERSEEKEIRIKQEPPDGKLFFCHHQPCHCCVCILPQISYSLLCRLLSESSAYLVVPSQMNTDQNDKFEDQENITVLIYWCNIRVKSYNGPIGLILHGDIITWSDMH